MGKKTSETITPAGGDKAAESQNDNLPADDKTPAADAPAGDKPAEKTFSQSDLDRAIAKATKDAEKKAADAEAKAKLSEDERKDAEAAELRAQLRERDARDAVKDEAAKLGVKNPAGIYRLIKDDLEFDDKGNITNLTDALDTAKADFPVLFDTKPSESIDAGAGTAASGQPLTKAAIEKMSDAEIAANMTAIDAFLATNK